MAKKRKQTRKKKNQQPEEQSNFWQLSGAVVMILLGLFLLLGGFGAGGPLPVNMFSGVYWALGWAAYIAPFLLAYLGALKFISEDKQIPLEKFASSIGILVFSSSWFYTAFVTMSDTGDYSGGHGGSVGELIGGASLNLISKFPASIMFFVLSGLAVFLTFNISPQVILKLGNIFKQKDNGDVDLAKLKGD